MTYTVRLAHYSTSGPKLEQEYTTENLHEAVKIYGIYCQTYWNSALYTVEFYDTKPPEFFSTVHKFKRMQYHKDEQHI